MVWIILTYKLSIETSVNCKAIAFVVFPMNITDDLVGMYTERVLITDKEYLELKQILSIRFNIPIYKLKYENNMSKITKTIINSFSQ